MSSHAHSAPHAMPAPTGFISKYIFSLDHKVIGIQYFLLALVAVCVGIVLSVLMRFHLVWPNAHLPFITGGIMTPEQYLGAAHHARHDHGVLRAHHRAAKRFRQLFSADSNRRRRTWLSRG